MRAKFDLAASVLAIVLVSPAAAQENARRAQARAECWAQFGIQNPNNTRFSERYREQVTACVRQKMGAGSQSQQPRR